jgi:hypothetical protein
MGLVEWFRRNRAPEEDPRLIAWRKSWTAAAASGDGAAAGPLRRELDQLGRPDEEIEIEQEMLAALIDLAALTTSVKQDGLPTIVTGHRIIREECCHFTAPVSMPDEPSQPSGRLFLTDRRAAFGGGGAASSSVPWHRVSEVMAIDRDLMLIGASQGMLCRFRCNSYSDVLCATFLARELSSAPRHRRAGL